ncbi:MAG TPA: hypothetical protein VGA30_06735 [Actinomycetota bacterium]
MEIRATLRQAPDGRWEARTQDGGPVVSGSSKEECLADLRRRLGRRGTGSTLVVEVLSQVVGVAEAAALMGWDKRRVITYLDRGRFPQPVQALASGRVWLRDDVEAFAHSWHARQRDRRAGGARR